MEMRYSSEAARELVREIGIIVLGVLIALFVGELATAARQRIEARRAMAAVRSDMIDNAPGFELTKLAVGCANRRLDAVAAIVSRARQTGKIPDLDHIPSRPSRTYRSGAWDRAVADGNVLFVAQERVATLTDYYEALRLYRNYQDEAALGWARLGVLVHVPGRIDDNTLAMVRQSIAEIRYQSGMAELISDLLLQAHHDLGYPVEYSSFNGKPTTRVQAIAALRNSETCRPLLIDGRPLAVTS